MLSKLLPTAFQVIAFADNNPPMDIPAITAEEAVLRAPDFIWIAVINRESREEIRAQLLGLGYRGEIHTLNELISICDPRLATLKLLASQMERMPIHGAVAELGVYQGAFAKEISACFAKRRFYLLDTFTGFASQDVQIESGCSFSRARCGDFANTSWNTVKETLPHPELAIPCIGYFPETIKHIPDDESFAFVSLDADLYQPTLEGLRFFYPRLNVGGALLIHDYNSMQFGGVRSAVDEYCAEHGLAITPVCDLHGSAVLMKYA